MPDFSEMLSPISVSTADRTKPHSKVIRHDLKWTLLEEVLVKRDCFIMKVKGRIIPSG